MRSRVMHLVMSVYVHMSTKNNRLFKALLLTGLLLSIICCLLFEFKCLQCGLLHPPSYTDRAVHAFQIGPLALKCFFWALTAHHALWARLAASVSVLVLQQLWCYACIQTGTCSAKWATSLGICCTCSTRNWCACSLCTGCVLWNSSFNERITFCSPWGRVLARLH